MKIQVSKATPIQLNWLVAKCEKWNGVGDEVDIPEELV